MKQCVTVSLLVYWKWYISLLVLPGSPNDMVCRLISYPTLNSNSLCATDVYVYPLLTVHIYGTMNHSSLRGNVWQSLQMCGFRNCCEQSIYQLITLHPAGQLFLLLSFNVLDVMNYNLIALKIPSPLSIQYISVFWWLSWTWIYRLPQPLWRTSE